MLSDGRWIAQSDWLFPEQTAGVTNIPDGKVLFDQAPFYLTSVGQTSAVDVETGRVLDASGAVIQGEGASSGMFFSWDGTTLTYLEPLS